MKAMYHKTQKCGGQYILEHTEAGVPYLICEKCQHQVDDWLKWQSEYKDYWKDEERWKNKRDHLICLLGVFANLYQEHYGTAFAFSFNERGLFRGSEANHVRKLYANFSGDAKTIRQYIEWVFRKKVAERKRKITSLGFLNTAAMINEFQLDKKKAKIIGRSTPLPQGMLKWINENAKELNDQMTLRDFGDLKILLKHLSKGTIKPTTGISEFVAKLQRSNIVNEELEIRNWSDNA